ncbi:MAG: ABC-type transport auxiliary lipoprotein family protein [Campylobacterota bacterium]|nr:ABC-type transport auxiliary lipoprotein family protein [Campylobacterota bacterium]
MAAKTAIIAGVLLLSGCSMKSSEIRTYSLNPDLNFSKLSHSPYKEKSIKIGYPMNIKGKASSSIYFSYSKIEEGSYQNAIWSSSNSQLLIAGIIRALEKGGVFKTVIDYNSLANTDYLLETEVYDFYHKVRKNLSVSVVSIRFDMIDTDNNRLVKSRKFSYEIPTGTVDALGYVKATNRALEKLAVDLVRWLGR